MVRRMIVALIYVLKISAKQGSFWPVKSLYTLIQETLNHKEDEEDFYQCKRSVANVMKCFSNLRHFTSQCTRMSVPRNVLLNLPVTFYPYIYRPSSLSPKHLTFIPLMSSFVVLYIQGIANIWSVLPPALHPVFTSVPLSQQRNNTSGEKMSGPTAYCLFCVVLLCWLLQLRLPC